MRKEPLRVAIGGGIGGLAAANALVRRDVEATVFEQAPELGEIGTGDDVALRVSAEFTELAAADLARLRRATARDGAVDVVIPAAQHAYSLSWQLATLPERARLRPRVAALAAEACYVVGRLASDQGDPQTALCWFQVARCAADVAGDPDVQAMCIDRQAWTLGVDLGKPQPALELVAQVPAAASPTARGYLALVGAELRAHAGQERACHRMLERGAATLQEATSGEASGWLWFVEATRDLRDVWYQGRSLVRLGCGDTAYPLLAGVRSRLPEVMHRNGGAVELDLARAAAQMGEPDRAAAHLLAAARVYHATQSVSGLRLVDQVRIGELAAYAATRAVREFDGHQAALTTGNATPARRLRPGARYVRTLPRSRAKRPSGGRWVLHTESCRHGRQATRREPVRGLRERSPAHLAADETVRTRFVPWGSCTRRAGPRTPPSR